MSAASLILCGLGADPKRTATLAALREFRAADSAWTDLTDPESLRLLRRFRPKFQDLSGDGATRVLAELEHGHSVAFATRGGPSQWGPQALALRGAALAAGRPCRTLGALSAFDLGLVACRQVLGHDTLAFSILELGGGLPWDARFKPDPAVTSLVLVHADAGEAIQSSVARAFASGFPKGHRALLFAPGPEGFWREKPSEVGLDASLKVWDSKGISLLAVPAVVSHGR